jgi:mannose-6-phosphate isomerase-like protein (cupin superfamily)
MTEPTKYIIKTDIQFPPLERMDIGELGESCPHDWFNQTLCRVNEAVVRLGVLQGDFHWHSHEREDEFFFVVEGRLLIDLAGDTLELNPRQGVVVPKGVAHRPRAPKRTVVLMVENATVKPTGDS